MLTNKSNSPFKKLKIAPAALPTIALTTSKVFPASFLGASANLSSHLLSFGVELPVPLSTPKTPVMARTVVEIVIERVVSIETIVIPCSQNKVQILSTNGVS